MERILNNLNRFVKGKDDIADSKVESRQDNSTTQQTFN